MGFVAYGIFEVVNIETPTEFCITKAFKSPESLYMWLRFDFETFLAKMSLVENKQVMFISSMCFDLELHELCRF